MNDTAGFLTFDEFFRHWAADRPDAVAQDFEGRITHLQPDSDFQRMRLAHG